VVFKPSLQVILKVLPGVKVFPPFGDNTLTALILKLALLISLIDEFCASRTLILQVVDPTLGTVQT